jgi:hypothetical protein
VTRGVGRQHVLVALAVGGVAGVLGDGFAAAQTPPPAAAASSTAQTPDRGRQQAAEARYKVRVMEGVLEKSVQQAALRLNEQLQRVSPDLIQLAGAAHARGYRLEGYGLFFDVEVPAAMRQTMGWTARVMRQQHEGVAEALGSLKRIAGELDPKARAEAERAMRQIELAVRPVPRGPRTAERPVVTAPPAGGAMGASTSTVATAEPGAPDVETPMKPATPPSEAEAMLWRSPDLAYEDQVREALIGAMLDWGALLPLGPDEWLTVAARDNQDVVMPGAAPDVVTIILRVKGSDLAERLSGRLPTDELRRRVEVREFWLWRCAPSARTPAEPFTCCGYNDAMRRAWLPLVLLAGVAGSIACRSEPDATKVVQVTDVVTGWLDQGIVNGQNKLVPTISLKIRNGADRPLSYLQLNAVFRIINDTEELGSKVIWATQGQAFAPGASLGPFNLSSDLGYSSPAARTQMLQHSLFKDAKVELFVKHGSRQWARLGEYRVDRQLFTK